MVRFSIYFLLGTGWSRPEADPRGVVSHYGKCGARVQATGATALEAGLAEIEQGETVTLSELRSELEERRPSAS